MGYQHRTMARGFALLAVALLATQALCAEVASLDNEREGDITYRISFSTAKEGEETSSTGTFMIEIKGTAGDSGSLFLVSHPGHKCGAEDSPRCYTNEHGVVPTAESRGSATCPCDVNLDDYKEKDAKWIKEPGLHQQVNLVAPDVGDIQEVKITTDSSEKWKLEGLKINTNSLETALGAGVFYVAGATIDSQEPLEAKLSSTTTAGDDMGSVEVGEACTKDADCKSGACDTGNVYQCELKCISADRDQSKDATHNCPLQNKSKITRCDAEVCEKEMDR